MIRATTSDPGLVHPRWQQYLAIATAGVLLFFRRHYPVSVMVSLTGAHVVIAGLTVP